MKRRFLIIVAACLGMLLSLLMFPFLGEWLEPAINASTPSNPAAASITSGAAERAATYEDALARAKETGKDIAVYQRGSDWNHLAENLLANVWNKKELEASLDAVILVVVDRPEVVGAEPVSSECPEDAEPPDEDSAPGDPSAHAKQIGRISLVSRITAVAPLTCEIETVQATTGTTVTRLADGSFLLGGANPHHEMLTVKVKTQSGGGMLRMDFLLHDSLPGKGPGRAGNSNFAINEIVMSAQDGTPIPLQAAWANAHDGGSGPWLLFDGIDKGDKSFWNSAGHRRQQRTLLLIPDRALPAGAEVTLRMSCKTPWGQHVPGCLRAAFLANKDLETDVRALCKAEVENARNSKFTWRGDKVPRIALMDCQGRPVTSEDKPRLGLTPAKLAARIREMQAMRAERDALWAQAEKEEGPRKAETLMKSLDLLKLGGSPGHENCCKFVHEAMKKADPKDESGCLRWLEFQTDPRCMPALVNPANKLAADKKYDEAIAMLDREIASPANRHLTHDMIQRIMMAKYHVYRQWKGNEGKRLDVLRDIIKLDSTTYLGLGATGYLAMFHKTPAPEGICYGWAAAQVKPGANSWDFNLDAIMYFDHAGRYCVRMLHSGGKDTIKIKRMALLDGGTPMTETSPNLDLAPGGKVEANLEIKAWDPARKLTLRVEGETVEGKTDVAGRFEVDPLL